MMSPLLSMELRKAFDGAPFKIALAVGVLLGLASAGLYVFWFLGFSVGSDGSVINLGVTKLAVQPDYYGMFYLSSPYVRTMSLDGMAAASSLFYVLAPLLCLVPYAWSYRTELSGGYLAQVYSRASRRSYYRAKAAATFASAFVVVLVPQVVNFIVLCCIFPLYTPTPVDALYTAIIGSDPWARLYYSVPWLYTALYFLVSSSLAGLWATLVLAISLLASNRVVLLVGPYLVLWIVPAAWNEVFSSLGLWVPELGLSGLMRMAGGAFHSDPWVMLLEGALFALIAWLVPRWRLGGDVL